MAAFAGILVKSHRIAWEAKIGDVNIPFDGVPYYVVGFQVLECQHGKDRNVYQKQRHALKQEVRTLINACMFCIKISDISANY